MMSRGLIGTTKGERTHAPCLQLLYCIKTGDRQTIKLRISVSNRISIDGLHHIVTLQPESRIEAGGARVLTTSNVASYLYY